MTFKLEDIRMVVEVRRVIFSDCFKAWLIKEKGQFWSGLGWRPYESYRPERFEGEEDAVKFLKELNKGADSQLPPPLDGGS